MKPTSTKGIKFFIIPSTKTAVSVSAWGTANNQVNISADPALIPGDYVYINSVPYKVTSNTGTVLDLEGFDHTTAGTAPGTLDAYKQADLVSLCPSEFAMDNAELQTISTATFCNPQASVISPVQSLGTLTINGFIDINDNAYAYLLESEYKQVTDLFIIELPASQGHLYTSGKVGRVSYGVQIDQALTWETSVNLETGVNHVYA